MAGSQDDIPLPPPPPPSQTPTQQTPHTVSTIKLPILKKGEYDIWAMKMEHYLAHTDYPVWEVIQNGNGPVSISTDTQGQIKILPPKSVEEILARERERKARTTLLMALPEDHLARFHNISDAKEIWDAIKTRFAEEEEEDHALMVFNSNSSNKVNFEAEKEKEDLKAKIEKWHNSSKNLSILLNSQMSANDKFGFGYGDYRYDGILSYETEVLQSVFMNKESDLENQPMYDRFVTAEGMHVSQSSESETQISDFDTCDSNCSDETHESLPELAVNEPKVVSQPKVWSDAPIIEEYESDSEDEHVSLPTEEQETPINTTKASGTNTVNTARHNVNRQAVPTNAANMVNTVKPIMNNARPKSDFHKSVSPFRKSLNRTTALRINFSYQKVNTAEVNAVSAIGGKRETAVKPSTGCNWRPKRHYWHKVSKYNG
ncbi:hypothetical protein Tco_0872911 [Tanacetum coccineum]